jgi:hypothetical protein
MLINTESVSCITRTPLSSKCVANHAGKPSRMESRSSFVHECVFNHTRRRKKAQNVAAFPSDDGGGVPLKYSKCDLGRD